MKTTETRFLIVGGGLAGLLLAWRLREHDVIVLGGASLPPASDVAAGVLNPVTGRRLTRMDDFAAFRDAARKTYRAISPGDAHYRDTFIRRYFLDPAEISRFEERRREHGYDRFLGERDAPGAGHPAVADPLGSFRIDGVGHVEPPPILGIIRDGLGPRHLPDDADWRTFDCPAGGLSLNGIRARAVICCEGVGVLRNPLFRWLPFRPVQGETLETRIPGLAPFPEILHHEKWILSLGGDRFRIGSTYRRTATRREGSEADSAPPPPGPTEEGRRELLAAARRILDLPGDPEVLDHRAGIRPASRDRLPYLGPHPTRHRLFICNGLGSKGALLAPLLTARLAEHLTGGAPLPPEFLPSRMIARGFRP
ncbi:MAG: NAD(P)/FAD-dependent oxidoreductase [Puniceicoccaceae bacterium]